MSDILSKICDDYDAYEILCEELGVKSLPLHKLNDDSKSFYDHERELREEYNLYKNYYGEYKPNKQGK